MVPVMAYSAAVHTPSIVLLSFGDLPVLMIWQAYGDKTRNDRSDCVDGSLPFVLSEL